MLVSEGSKRGLGSGGALVKASQASSRGGFAWILSSLRGGDSGSSGEGRAPVVEASLLLGDRGESEWSVCSHCFSGHFSSK